MLANLDADLVVAGGTGAINRMSFTDVYGQELNAVAIAAMKFLEGSRLGPVGASGEAAEDQDDGFLAMKVR